MVARRTLDAPPGSVGRVDPDLYTTRVVDENEDDVPSGEVGELLVRPLLPWTTTQGYFGMPERTLEAFRNLWFHTGDAARLDADGNLWFVDRIKDRIRRRGENIASVDVESVLAEHPAIADAAVVAVPADEEGGEDEIKAVVVARAGATLDPQDVWDWCDEKLPYFAVHATSRILPDSEDTDRKVRKSRRPGNGDHAGDDDRGPSRAAAARRLTENSAAAAHADPPTGITATIASTSSSSGRSGASRRPGVDLDERRLELCRVDRAEQQLDELRLERAFAQHPGAGRVPSNTGADRSASATRSGTSPPKPRKYASAASWSNASRVRLAGGRLAVVGEERRDKRPAPPPRARGRAQRGVRPACSAGPPAPGAAAASRRSPA
jgi:hypothetical protein